MGTEVRLVLPLPDRAPPLACRAVVVRGTIALTGLRLVGLSPDERQRIDRFAFGVRRLLEAREGGASALT